MSSALLVASVVASLVIGGGEPQSPQRSVALPESRPFHEINRQLRAAMRREATRDDAPEWAATVVELTGLYREIVADPRLPTSRTLESYRATLRHRLMQLQRELQREMGRGAQPRNSRRRSLPIVYRVGPEHVALAWSLGGGAFGAPSVLGGTTGGMLSGARGGAARTDYGPALVDLIQRTIAPEFWDVTGGPGSIAYYPLWYALVVRATGEIHGRVTGPTGRTE